MNKWENFGDVNPIEHGGFFIKQDEDFSNMYHVVKVSNGDYVPGFTITDGVVEIEEDSWIEWDSVKATYDIQEDDGPERLVEAAYGYYGYQNFGGQETNLDTEEEVLAELKTYGITEEDFR